MRRFFGEAAEAQPSSSVTVRGLDLLKSYVEAGGGRGGRQSASEERTSDVIKELQRVSV